MNILNNALLSNIFLLLSITLVIASSLNNYECGVPNRRHYRTPREAHRESVRIIRGRESKRGAWPWQISLQLLHPKYGFIGHWCGGVLIHPLWLLTAAHCVNNELFNLPVPALWTAVLGEWDRSEQTGSYVSVDRIVLHTRFHHYQHDIALMKLSKAADISFGSKIKIICLPDSNKQEQSTPAKKPQYFGSPAPKPATRQKPDTPPKASDFLTKYLEKINNLTKSVLGNMLGNKKKNMRYNIRVAEDDDGGNPPVRHYQIVGRENHRVPRTVRATRRIDKKNTEEANGSGEESRRDKNNAKKLHFSSDSLYDVDGFEENNDDNYNHLVASNECYVTGWGRAQTNGSLTDTLLEASVPPLPIEACLGKYPENLPLKDGHLCAGNTDGSTGTCVGDSGGPLQCFGNDNRWVLKGITSFGSGCAKPGFPDVYTYVPHYVPWIVNVINNN